MAGSMADDLLRDPLADLETAYVEDSFGSNISLDDLDEMGPVSLPQFYDPAVPAEQEARDIVQTFAAKFKIPFFEVNPVLRAANYDYTDLLEDDGAKPCRPVSLMQQIPRPTVSTRCAAKKTWNSVVKPLFKYASEHPDELDGSPELIRDAATLLYTDFTPIDLDEKSYEVKRSTIGPAILALKHHMSNVLNEKPSGSSVRVLAEGCGAGSTDMYRIVRAFDEHIPEGKTFDLVVDLHDPIVSIEAAARRSNPSKRTIPGKNYPKGATSYKAHIYDLIFCCNSFHYAAEKLGNSRAQLDNLVHALRPNGVLVGLFPELRGMASVAGSPIPGSVDSSPSRYVQLLDRQADPESGNEHMTTHCFGRVYKEPVVDILDLDQYVTQKLRSNCLIYNNQDCYRFTSSINPKLQEKIAPVTPERAGWCSVIITNSGNAHRRDYYDDSLLPTSEIETYPWSNSRTGALATYHLGAGFALRPHDIRKILDGGPYLVSSKTDGVPAYCIWDTTGRLTIHSPLGEQVHDLPFNKDHSYEFQVEVTSENMTMVQLFCIDGQPVTLGYGYTHTASSAANDPRSIFTAFCIKQWSPLIADEDWYSARYNEYASEGMVIQAYMSPPPPERASGSDPTVRRRIECYYVKHHPTIDLALRDFRRQREDPSKFVFMDKGLEINYPMGFIPATAKPTDIWEFTLTGVVKGPRKDKKFPNTIAEIRSIRHSIKMEDAAKFLASNARRYGPDPKTANVDFLNTKEKKDWNMRDLFYLAISYPKHLNLTCDEAHYVAISKMRLHLYKNPTLHTYLDNNELSAVIKTRFL